MGPRRSCRLTPASFVFATLIWRSPRLILGPRGATRLSLRREFSLFPFYQRSPLLGRFWRSPRAFGSQSSGEQSLRCRQETEQGQAQSQRVSFSRHYHNPDIRSLERHQSTPVPSAGTGKSSYLGTERQERTTSGQRQRLQPLSLLLLRRSKPCGGASFLAEWQAPLRSIQPS